MTDSSDDDSFHSVSDGEQHKESDRTSFKNTDFADSKDSNDGFEKVEQPVQKEENVIFKVPQQPAPRRRKESVKSSSTSSLSKTIESSSAASADKSKLSAAPSVSDEDDDWFKTQMDEYEQKDKSKTMEHQTANVEKKQHSRLSSDSEDEKHVKKSIWDWTGIHDVVNAVGEGISTAVEVGLGLPPAEEMARLSVAERRKLLEEAQHMKEPEPSLSSDEGGIASEHNLYRPKKSSAARQYQHQKADVRQTCDKLPQSAESAGGSLSTATSSMSGFFSTGGIFSNLVSAPLDVLETLGKKTFETLTTKDEGKDGEKRRFFLHGINASEGQSLSQILRERRELDTPSSTGGSLSKGQRSLSGFDDRFNTSFISLFEKNEGMVHLEGLELLSRDQDRRSKGATESSEFAETLAEFCVQDVSECLTEDFEQEFAKSVKFISLPFKPDDVLETNHSLTQELSLRQAAVDATEQVVVEAIHEAAITALAKLTAHSISSLHKIAQLIIIAKKLPEVESLFAFTYLLCRRLSFFATQYSNILNVVEMSEQVDEVVTNIFFECSNACHDVKKALELLRPFFRKR